MNKLVQLLKFIRSHPKEGSAIILLVVLCALSTVMSGDAAYNLQSVLMTYYRLAQLLLWALIAGWVNDQIHGEKFHEHRSEIERDPTRSYSRTLVLCALIVSGAMLLKPL